METDAAEVVEPDAKRLKTGIEVREKARDFSLARQLISSFEGLEAEVQDKLLTAIDGLIQQDKRLLTQALRQQVMLHVHRARELFEQRRFGPLEELLQSLAPAAAIMLNIEISLVAPSYTEESATLARTLLPYIDQVADYRFLGAEHSFITGRFLHSLAVHIKDVQSAVTPGFVAFALHLNPAVLKGIVTVGDGLLSLRRVLLDRGFKEAAVSAMCLYPAKFLWQDLLAFWADKSPDVVTQCVEILSRMEVLTDPGEQMEELVVVLAQRSLLAKCLLKSVRIGLTLSKLVRVL